jgi:hypothetical protein
MEAVVIQPYAKHCRAFQLSLLGSNQDSPDPERRGYLPEFQQLAAIHTSWCHPLLEFDNFNARLCPFCLLGCGGLSGTPYRQVVHSGERLRSIASGLMVRLHGCATCSSRSALAGELRAAT